MKTTKHSTKTRKTPKSLRDMKPKKNAVGGHKSGGGGRHHKSQDYLKIELKEVFLGSVGPLP